VNLSEPFEIFILWAHAMAAVAWIGGSIFYALALNPALEEVGPTPERISLVSVASREFRELVKLGILVFIVTGVILTVSRLSLPRVTNAYVAVLVVKVSLSMVMFWLAGRLGPRQSRGMPGEAPAKPRPWWLRPQYLILMLGSLVTLLSQVLRVLYEQSLVSVN
jgi:uncharacterized membrane protein